MRAICHVEHPPGRKSIGELRYCNMRDVLEMIQNNYYGTGYKEQKHVITNVNLDMVNLTAEAGVEIVMNTETRQIVKSQTVSYLDVFVTCSQLAQVILYSLDGLVRHETSTLWMLRTYFSEFADDANDGMRAKAVVSSTQIIELNGRRWRNAEIVGTLGNKVAKITFAHALPSASC
jgi:hypothetical protein